jgi:hypothetical protein
VDEDNLPKELYSFFRWVIQGPNTTLSSDAKTSTVNKNAISLAQTAVSMYLSKHQVARKTTQTFKTGREMPQQLAVAVAIRQAIRSKKVINILHGFGMSVEYNRVLRVESQIATSVLKRMLDSDGLYVPPGVILGRYIFFAVDNVDFAEDTPDGKHTLHATAMAIYQRCQDGDETSKLELGEPSGARSLKELPSSVTTLLECPKPAAHPPATTCSTFVTKEEEHNVAEASLPDTAWMLSQSLLKVSPGITGLETNLPDEETPQENIPTWSGYHSLVSQNLPTTRVGAPPLLAAPAHEWSTLLTILKQAQGINTKVVGPDRKTVISLDMGLYKPAKQLQMARSDMDHLVLRPGELHFVMAQLRTIGAFIENSGLDFSWTEANLYGPATVKQILEGRHVRRGIEAHLITTQTLFLMYQDAFFKENPELVSKLTAAAEDIRQACTKRSSEVVLQAHVNMLDVMKSLDVTTKMTQFDSQAGQKPLFIVMRQYMQMVMDMLQFIRSVRTGDWNLHLLSTKVFVKYYFAHSKLNYARMIPVYLADMERLRQSDPDIYGEFLTGNWVVNKNKHVPFCAVGADHGLEHINRSMKVTGGLVGITLNPSARTKFFLISPELARLAAEAQEMAGLHPAAKESHHALSDSIAKRHSKAIDDLTTTMEAFSNPFTEDCDELFNLATKAVMPEKVSRDLCRQTMLGQQLFDDFVTSRINTSETNLWAPMKSCRLQTWKTAGKRVKVNLGQKVMELKEDRNIFARLLLVSKSRPEINLEEAVGCHELSVVPRSMFAADGEMLHCHTKSNLMAILESLPHSIDTGADTGTAHDRELPMETSQEMDQVLRVAVVDGMAEVQSMGKPEYVLNCSQLADHFTSRILDKYGSSDEVRVIFDRYDVQHSLKQSTRDRRQGSQTAVAYHITDSTSIGKIPLKRLLSHGDTKKQLTGYLADKLLQQAHASGQAVVVAWGTQCRASHTDKRYLNSDHEEADTKLILHAADATACGATSIRICSPDTDVFILAVRHYPELCKDTTLVAGTGRRTRAIQLGPIYEILGPRKAAALPALHALSGSDNTGSFAGKGKHAFWKAFQDATDNIITALISLGATKKLNDDTAASIEQFICTVYLPQTEIESVKKLRWWLFRKKQAESERLPPTPDALRQAILRAHHQTFVWNQATVTNPVIPPPADHGWKQDGDRWIPIMTTQLPAPESVLHLVKCGCKKQCRTERCSCRKAGLSCSDICGCLEDGENPCENSELISEEYDSTDVDDDE